MWGSSVAASNQFRPVLRTPTVVFPTPTPVKVPAAKSGGRVTLKTKNAARVGRSLLRPQEPQSLPG
jgi:hypothetical protein